MEINLLINIILGSIVLFLVIWSVILHFKFNKLGKLMKSFLAGKDGKDLEQVILQQAEEQKQINQGIKTLNYNFNSFKKIAKSGIKKIGVIRYNSFDDMGGEQSFSLAILDNTFSGIVISSLHGRNVTRIYAKTINNLTSNYPLSKEEKTALEKAKKSET